MPSLHISQDLSSCASQGARTTKRAGLPHSPIHSCCVGGESVERGVPSRLFKGTEMRCHGEERHRSHHYARTLKSDEPRFVSPHGNLEPQRFRKTNAFLYNGSGEGPEPAQSSHRFWLNDGSCVPLRPKRPNHVWSHDFVQDRTADGRVNRTLNIIDEYTREALMIRVNRKLNSTDVLDALTDLFILRGPPDYIRSDNGPEFIAQKVRDWIAAVGAKTAYIEPGSPWEN